MMCPSTQPLIAAWKNVMIMVLPHGVCRDRDNDVHRVVRLDRGGGVRPSYTQRRKAVPVRCDLDDDAMMCEVVCLV